ncbi:TIGR02281 family clan AA aspartic protease [Allosphingosinicella flava]|uniref:TIGR02281 family clan AA aspartic protease n=2 Tax=Allosphingosinicella flava TaxID=2771430 RepID=A0A7T2GLT1_9SPHN|nr:TIGR02281 family clan AA aspartic protease [Sphingosinicella flava]
MLIGSALFARQIPMRSGLKMALGWLIIFFIAFAAFTLRDDFRSFGNRLSAEWNGGAVQQGKELRIPRADDGHYWIEGRLNGQPVRFLVDSGATITSLNSVTAAQAGVELSGGFPVAVETANGTVTADRARVKRLQIGEIVREDFPVHVSETFGDTNVLGMNFLSSLSSWGVEGTWLVLRP